MNKGRVLKKHILKRVFDVLFSSSLIMLLLPFFILIATLLIIEGYINPAYKGPVFFKEIRISRGKRFYMYKFRTVKADILRLLKKGGRSITEFTSYQVKGKYLTPVGIFLARRYLDELPQLFNVIKGDMSLVGPRPHVPSHYENDLKAGIVSARYMRTGLLGLVQASKGNPELRNAFARMASKHYTRNKTMALIDRLYFQKYRKASGIEMLFYDMSIIVRCLIVVLKAEGF